MRLGAHTHTRALQSLSIQSCTEGSKDQGLRRLGRPSAAASIYMCIAEKSTNCSCEHTHVGRGVGLHPRIRGHKGSPDQKLLRAYTCALQNKSNQAAPKGGNVTRVRQTACCCKRTHVCCRLIQLRISDKDQRLQRFGRPPAAAGTNMCVAE